MEEKMEEKLEKIKQQLHSQNYKLTPQREATVRVLLENEEDHLSAEDVYLLVKDKAPEIGLATVYRTLDLLSELKIIHRMNFGDGVARYDLRDDASEYHHHHLVCLNCGTVDEIFEDLLVEAEQKVNTVYNFTILDHRLTFYGICHRCIDHVKPDDFR